MEQEEYKPVEGMVDDTEQEEIKPLADGAYFLRGNTLIPNPKGKMGTDILVEDGKIYSFSAFGKNKEISRPEAPCHGDSPKDCPHCGAKFQGWFATDRSTGRELEVGENWGPQHRDLTYSSPKWNKPPKNIPVTVLDLE